MVEFYRTLEVFWASIYNERCDERFTSVAEVSEGPIEGRFYIRYSHTYHPTVDAGPYYSDSYTSADTLSVAKMHVENWFEDLEKAPAIKVWCKDLLRD